jgi:homocitrate synthase NifV
MVVIPQYIDTTLRDGEQSPGVVFSLTEKIEICTLLNKVGVPEVEIGTPAMGKRETDEIHTLCSMGYNFKTIAWCRGNKNDVKAAARSGADKVHISLPVSSIHLKAMEKDESWVLEQLFETMDEATLLFDWVSVGAQDASRASLSFLKEFVGAARFAGASRIRLSDTVGILNPFSSSELVSSIHTLYKDLPIEFHGHNDLGMATANTVAAFLAGASGLSTTVNGLGERAGNAAMEEVAMALELSAGIPQPLNSCFFSELSDYVSKASGRLVLESKPIIGSLVQTHESGIHTKCLLKNRTTYEIFSAERIGKQTKPFLIGKHSGRSSLIDWLSKSNLSITNEMCSLLLTKVRALSQQKKSSLTDDELVAIYKEIHSVKN